MEQGAYTYRYGDGSLEYRVSQYRETLESYKNVQKNTHYADDPMWADTLGHKEDIEQAERILEQSLSHVTSMIDHHDLKLALSQGWLTEPQAEEFSQIKAQMEFEQVTKNKSGQSQSSGQSL